MSRASTRVSICWPPTPASEPTDTLVLSIGGFYVDLRVKKCDGSIDWLLAGERIVVSQHPVQVKFTHSIDSHHDPSTPEPAPDVGKFTKLPNGDDLETGEMPNPEAGGEIMEYEEVWRELDWATGAENGNVNWILESIGDGDDRSQSKTFYAKLGRFYLAARKSTHGETATFAALREDFDANTGKWKLRYEIGDVNSLTKLDADEDSVKDEKQWKVGDKAVFGQAQYVVRAVSSD